jgi:hypothetical protein
VAATILGATLYCNAPFSKGAASERDGKKSTVALFVSQFGGKKEINVFNADLKQIGVIGQNGGSILAVDAKGDLYDAQLDEPYLEIWKPPYNDPTIVTPPLPRLSSVAVDRRTGVFAILASTRPGGGATVFFYRPHQTSPCDAVSVGALINTASVFDREGTLFFEAGDPQTIFSVSGECSATNVLQLSFKTPIYPGWIAVSKDDNIVIQSFGSADDKHDAKATYPIYTYAHPANGQFGDPIATTILTTYGNNPETLERMLALGSDGTTLWGCSNFASGLRLFRYPRGGNSIRTIDTTPGTVAVFPPLVP